MLLESTVLPIIIAAGLMNGSFVIPVRYIKNLVNEKIWLYHSIIGLAIIPWIILAISAPDTAYNYKYLPNIMLFFLIFGGIIFGLGQVCFAYAIEYIGVALSFAVNLGIGVTLGSMFVPFYKGTIFNAHSYLVVLAVIIILLSLLLNYYAGKNKSGHKENYQEKFNYQRGWILAIITGFTSGLQNITFIIVATHSQTQLHSINSFWVWPPFLFAAAIPMFLGFLYRVNNNSSIVRNNTINHLNIKDILLVTLMGLFFTGSLALYSSGMSKLTHQQQIIGWPAFMVSIILASQMWGRFYNQPHNTSRKNSIYSLVSIILLFVAIVLLAT